MLPVVFSRPITPRIGYITYVSPLPCPEILTQPSNNTVSVSEDADFQVVVSGGATTFQWQVSIDAGVSWDDITDGPEYDGTDTSTLTVLSTSFGQTDYQFRVLVAQDGCPGLTSDAAVLTVSGTPMFTGALAWIFGGTIFTITPQSAVIVGEVIQLTFASEWSLHAPGSIPLKIYRDSGFTDPYSGEFNGNAAPGGGPVIQTKDFPLTGGYLIQTNTNFTGNYTSPGDNGSTGQIHVFLG